MVTGNFMKIESINAIESQIINISQRIYELRRYL